MDQTSLRQDGGVSFDVASDKSADEQPTSDQPTVDRPVVIAKPGSPLRKTAWDVFRSVGLVFVVILVILLITWRPQPDPVREVDAYPIANLAARDTSFKVLYPQPGDGWRATSARLEASDESADSPVWFTGWVSPDNEFAALAQSEANHSAFIAEQTDDGQLLGAEESSEVLADGDLDKGWAAYENEETDTRSLVRVKPDSATIVTGTLSWEQLREFRDALVPVKKVTRETS